MNTIAIGGEQIPRTVVGAICRLELATEAFYPKARADVDFLRDEFNRVEAQRDELVAELQNIARATARVFGVDQNEFEREFVEWAQNRCRHLLAKLEAR